MALTSEQITDYASLQTQVANVLNRESLSSDVPLLIQLAEKRFEKDERCRKLQDHGTFQITGDGDTFPADYDSLEEWYYHGTSYYGPIEIVPAHVLSYYKSQFGTTGVPRVAAIIDGTLRYGPPPDQSYNTILSYWRKIVNLDAVNTTNWLLLDSPEIYLYGTLVEAEPFLKNDSRIATWQSKLEEALNNLDRATQRKQWSGTMRARIAPRRVIGG